MTVAVLYCDPRGRYPRMCDPSCLYCGGGGVCSAMNGDDMPCERSPLDCWDESRDARLYDGPWPVVAHPPCKHWSKLRHMAHVQCAECHWSGRESVLGHAPGIGPYCPECGYDGLLSDRDCAPRAVEQVRKWGGVLEHPAGSKLWEHHSLPLPNTGTVDQFGGYSVELAQCEWGHPARKRTWLYLVGVPHEALEAPPFPGRVPTHWCSGGRNYPGRKHRGMAAPPGIKCASAQQRRRTPPLFAEYLVRLAHATVRPAT